MALLIALLLILAALIPAPLQEQANIARVPNPVKSAWFLLWIQELVSYSKYLIYAVLAMAGAFLLLPWLSRQAPPEKASWLQRESLPIRLAALAACIAILALTAVAMFFRGENWQLVAPF